MTVGEGAARQTRAGRAMSVELHVLQVHGHHAKAQKASARSASKDAVAPERRRTGWICPQRASARLGRSTFSNANRVPHALTQAAGKQEPGRSRLRERRHAALRSRSCECCLAGARPKLRLKLIIDVLTLRLRTDTGEAAAQGAAHGAGRVECGQRSAEQGLARTLWPSRATSKSYSCRSRSASFRSRSSARRASSPCRSSARC